MSNYILRMYDDLPVADARVMDLPMMYSPYPTLIICIAYAILAKIVGPKLMEKREPFQIDKIMILYNLFQVLFSGYFLYMVITVCWLPSEYGPGYSFWCQPVDYSANPMAEKVAFTSWLFYMSKFVELLDTLFFVVRKKNRQITTLHVIHHGVMPMVTWSAVKYVAGGHSTLFGLLNCFVHIVMYSYYLFAALGPQFQKYLWWKKYLTRLQLIQFVILMIHDFNIIISDCDYPKMFAWLSFLNALMFFCLFMNFYIHAYKSEKQKKTKKLN